MQGLGTKRQILFQMNVPLFENYAPYINIPVRYSMHQTISQRAKFLMICACRQDTGY